MVQNKNANILFTKMRIIHMAVLCLNFFQQVNLNELVLKILTWINIPARLCSYSWLWIPKRIIELHNDYPLASDEIEIKKEMLSNYQLMISDIYNIPIGNIKN